METTIQAPVSLTPSAITEVKKLMTEPGFDATQALRVGVKGGGVPVVMKKAHGIYLQGMQVDFEDGLNARGFVFKNPNASSTCGCGSSFAV